MKELAAETEGNFPFEYSPESFTGTELDYALKSATQFLMYGSQQADNKAIINIPTTVENAMPHVFATQIEYMREHLKYREM